MINGQLKTLVAGTCLQNTTVNCLMVYRGLRFILLNYAAEEWNLPQSKIRWF